MSTRRALLLAVGWLTAVTPGCKRDALSASGTSASSSAGAASAMSATGASTAPSNPRDETHHGIRFLVFFRGGADEQSPLVIGMHGRGGSPERFSRVVRDFTGRAEIALAQGPFKLDQGYSWLPEARRWDDPAAVTEFDAVEKQLWQAIAELSRGRPVIVTGFSQGGMLSFVLAARHPREIAYAFPMGGAAPPALFPRDHAPTAPVYAMHGTSDQVVELPLARATISAFREQGAKAELREFAGVGHDMPPAVRDDLLSHLLAALDDVNHAPSLGAAPSEVRAASGPGVREGDAASESIR